jgi:hypothetical protein
MMHRPANAEFEDLVEFFRFEHLPPHLQPIAFQVAELASAMADALPHNGELLAGLRKLLEAKDCFVRAKLLAPPAAHDGP